MKSQKFQNADKEFKNPFLHSVFCVESPKKCSVLTVYDGKNIEKLLTFSDAASVLWVL